MTYDWKKELRKARISFGGFVGLFLILIGLGFIVLWNFETEAPIDLKNTLLSIYSIFSAIMFAVFLFLEDILSVNQIQVLKITKS